VYQPLNLAPYPFSLLRPMLEGALLLMD